MRFSEHLPACWEICVRCLSICCNAQKGVVEWSVRPAAKRKKAFSTEVGRILPVPKREKLDRIRRVQWIANEISFPAVQIPPLYDKNRSRCAGCSTQKCVLREIICRFHPSLWSVVRLSPWEAQCMYELLSVWILILRRSVLTQSIFISDHWFLSHTASVNLFLWFFTLKMNKFCFHFSCWSVWLIRFVSGITNENQELNKSLRCVSAFETGKNSQQGQRHEPKIIQQTGNDSTERNFVSCSRWNKI